VAIGATLLTSAYDNTDATSYATASVSPSANSLMVLFVNNTKGSGWSPGTIPTSSHGTWVKWGDRAWAIAPGSRRMGLWTLQCGASPGSGAITLTNTDQGDNAQSAGTSWAVIQVTGHHVANPVRQAAMPPGTTAVQTSYAITLSDPIDANSRAFAFFSLTTNASLTERTNWTELADVAGATVNSTSQTQWRSDAFETTASATFSSAECCGIAVEIAEAGAANDARAIVKGREVTSGVAVSPVACRMPTDIAAGDLLVASIATDLAATAAAGGGEGWTQISATSNASAVRLTVLAKVAAGGDALNLTLGSAVDSSTHVVRITDHGVSNVASDIVLGTAATGTSAAPDPPSVTPAANEPNLFYAIGAADDDDYTTVFSPTSYTGEANTRSGALSATTSTVLAAYRYVTTGSAQDPGAFTLAASEEWVTQTLCIPPGGLVVSVPTGALLLYDSRYWDGTLTDIDAGDPGSLPNLGSLGGAYDAGLDIANATPYDISSFINRSDGSPLLPWAGIGGYPQAAPFTFIFATGVPTIVGGDAKIAMAVRHGTSGPEIYADVYASTDQTIVSAYDVIDTGMEIIYDSGERLDNTVWFVEFNFPNGAPATCKIWQGETLVDSSTHADFGSDIDDAFSATFAILASVSGAETTHPVGDPWPGYGVAMVRAALDSDDREEWREYFFGPAEEEEVSCDDPLRFPLFDDFGICVEVMWDGATWTSVTEDLRAMTIRLPSRSRLQAVFQSGSASLTLDNRLRTYDPLYADGPYFGDLKANRQMRVGFAVSGDPVTFVFTGWTDGWSFAYDKSNNDATATITCIDALAKAGFSSIPAGTTPALTAGEYVATRGDALVTAAGSTDITYSAAIGYARFGTTWDATVQHNLLAELRRCAELEVAPLLALDDGTLHQEARYWFATRALSATSNCTIPSATLPCTEVRVLYDARELVSAVSMTDEVGNVATATNSAAVTEFGERYADLNFNNMPAGDASSLAGAAATWVGLRGGEEMRFDTVTILPQRSDSWWQHIQDRRPLDRVTVSLTPTDVGDPITQDAFIDGIEHHVTPDSWVTYWHLLPADLYAAVDFFILGTDVLNGAKVLGY
jgi:hypothetical protein